MSWVKMDDRWPSNRKLRQVEPLDRLVWAMAIAYTSDQRTDGRLDGPMLEMVAFLAGHTMPYEAADRLVRANLFELDAVSDGGAWKVHDYGVFNPLASQVDDLRAKRAEAGRRGGTRSGATRRSNSEANASDVASGASKQTRTPSRPVPSRNASSAGERAHATRVNRLLAAAADTKARDTPGVRSVAALRAHIIATAADDGLTDAIEHAIARNPDADDPWIVDEALGRPHPYTPPPLPSAKAAAAALRGDNQP